jgi:hypothetical protein
MEVFKPPVQFSKVPGKKVIFLAGTIDMGNSVDWQQKITEQIQAIDKNNNVVILNPRRDAWDNSWKQDESDPNFNQQVNWELDGLEASDIIILYIAHRSKSPISLLELGLHAKDNKVLICMPGEFYRAGNIQITAKKYNIPLFTNFYDLFKELVIRINS